MRNIAGFLIGMLLLTAFASAQNNNIRGFVYNQETSEPIIFTNVILKGTSYGAVTDVNGFFSITKIPDGSYTIVVSSLGFDSLKEEITLRGNQIVTKKLMLTKGALELKMFDVSAERQEAKTEVQMSVVKITPQDIQKIPTVGGEADLAQYLQVLPGVIFTGDQGGQLYIRGGSPIQNKVLLDGMIIYNPFHSIGLFSVFDTDIIRNADVYTGGFSAEYGGRISSIMDITTRDGKKNHMGGKISVSPFQAKALLEGPLKKAKNEKDGSISYILSAKHSYLDETSKSVYSYIDTLGLPFSFTDIYGKVSFNASNGSKLNLFGFNFKDNVNYRNVSQLGWNNYGVGANFILVPQGSSVFVEGDFSYTSYLIEYEENNNDATRRASGIDGFNFGLDFTYFLGDNNVKYGIEVQGFSTDFIFFNSLNRQITQTDNTTELAGYVKYKMKYGNLVLDPSLRLHYYASLNNFSPEPRLGAKYNVSDKFRIKAAGGLYSQNLISATSDRDVVNLFYGFLSGPDNLQRTFLQQNGQTRDVNHRLQKATHAIFGFEYDVTRNLNVNIEGYYKWFNQLSELNRNKIFEDNTDNANRPDALKKDFIIESGNAYGVDFVAKYEFKRMYLWAVYSIAKVDRWDGQRTYSPVFDRRHNVNLVGAYSFGKDLDWEFNVRWNFGSGFPFTPTQGNFESFSFIDGIGTDYVFANGQLETVLGDLNSSRLPTYHRLDINLKKLYYVGEEGVIEINAGATNMYNRQNIFFFDRNTKAEVYQLPLMPSLGASYTF